ncbi:MAG: hypothetical protein M5R42_12735 [Rhodocyclaceae bacterium]|nr:hypothetical protein [Rhodocyclaceae bacterium]
MRGLSDDSRQPPMGQLRELAPRKLQYFTEIDYEQHMALIATDARRTRGRNRRGPLPCRPATKPASSLWWSMMPAWPPAWPAC